MPEPHFNPVELDMMLSRYAFALIRHLGFIQNPRNDSYSYDRPRELSRREILAAMHGARDEV